MADGVVPQKRDAFAVFPYSVDKLEEIVAGVLRNPADVSAKLHREYFKDYFSNLNAKTIVVENDYIDRDFLEDFAAYYVRCFGDYERKCARLHFFKTEFTTLLFTACLSRTDSSLTETTLQENYLGFIVIKPLPQTFIGRTCLSTYDTSSTGRYFPATFEYDANLFGIPLKIKRTLPFQEQDSVVAACATSALWSAFHGTGKIFQHSIPSPAAITAAATEHLPAESRTMPNRGLSSHMMAQAIRRVGLEPYLVKAQDHYILRSTLYAYLRSKVPVILGIQLYDTSVDPSDRRANIGKHAVTVVGFSLGLQAPSPLARSGFLLRASRMDKIYVHDDQVGPFARMELVNNIIKINVNGNTTDFPALTTSWRGLDEKIGSVSAISDILLMPLYHKIRIPYETILDAVIHFDELLAQFAKQGPPLDGERLEWDIFLTTVNGLKTRLFSEKKLSGEQLLDIVSSRMPRYIWRATAYKGKDALLDLIFDATDIEQGEFIVRVIEYDPFIGEYLRELLSDPAFDKIFRTHRGRKILKWFKDRRPIN